MKHQKIVICFLAVLGAIFMVNGQDEKTGAPSASVNARTTKKTGSQAVSIDTNKWKIVPKGTRQITIVEDRSQSYMVSKVYILKHVKGCDIRPWVEGAVRRANSESNVQRLNYKAGKKQYLVVNMPSFIVDDIDDMIEKIDRPGMIAGTGISRFVYRPQYRSTQDIMDIIQGPIFSSGEAAYFRDIASNTIYGKNSASDGAYVTKYLKFLDRPVPQVEMRINMYEVNLNDLSELGIDYIKWKNGPGADLLNIGADLLNFNLKDEFLGNAIDLISKGSHSWAGFLVAPSFDASFLRLLAQKGKARVATSGILTVANDYTDPGISFTSTPAPTYRLTFIPQFQNITKDDNQEITVANNTSNTYQFHLRSPSICFKPAEDNIHEVRDAAVMTFGWVLSNGSVVERDNNGDEIINTNTIRSFLSISPGNEKLIASFKRKHDVNQNNGMPFLSDIPVLKYIFGSTTDSEADYKIFVTIETKPLPPRADLTSWAGNIINLSESIQEEKTSDPEPEPEPELQQSSEDIEEIK